MNIYRDICTMIKQRIRKSKIPMDSVKDPIATIPSKDLKDLKDLKDSLFNETLLNFIPSSYFSKDHWSLTFECLYGHLNIYDDDIDIIIENNDGKYYYMSFILSRHNKNLYISNAHFEDNSNIEDQIPNVDILITLNENNGLSFRDTNDKYDISNEFNRQYFIRKTWNL